MPQLSFDQLKQYQNKWIAFVSPDEGKIIASGITLSEARQQAKQNGFPHPIFFKVLPDTYFIPML